MLSDSRTGGYGEGDVLILCIRLVFSKFRMKRTKKP